MLWVLARTEPNVNEEGIMLVVDTFETLNNKRRI